VSLVSLAARIPHGTRVLLVDDFATPNEGKFVARSRASRRRNIQTRPPSGGAKSNRHNRPGKSKVGPNEPSSRGHARLSQTGQ
jgi:hypothetical protein